MPLNIPMHQVSVRSVFGIDSSSSLSSSSPAATPVVTPLASSQQHQYPQRSGIPAIALPAAASESSSSPSSPSESNTNKNLCAQCRQREATESALREDISDLESSLTAAQVILTGMHVHE